MKIDTSDLTGNLDNEEKLIEQLVLDHTTKITLDATKDLIIATPVDTGTARQGWKATVPTSPYQGGVIENNVEYIGVLNDGWSEQAPAQFVEGVVARYSRKGGNTK